MKISAILTLGFSIVLIIAVAAVATGIAGMGELRESGRIMYEERVMSLQYVSEAVSEYYKMRLNVRGVIIKSFYDDKKGAVDSRDKCEDHYTQLLEWMRKSRSLTDDPGMIVFHDDIQTLLENEYRPKMMTILQMCINDTPDHNNKFLINIYTAQLTAIAEQIEAMMVGLVARNTALAEQADIDNMQLTQRYLIIQIALLIAVAVVIVFVALLTIKSIAVPINESAMVLKEISKGNFSARVTGRYKGEFKRIKHSVNDTAIQLSQYLDEKMHSERLVYQAGIEKARAEAVMESINYASRIQRGALPPDQLFAEAFSDSSIRWDPRDIVGGDVYWIKKFEAGTVLCVGDCTGHGTSGALLTMLVLSTLESVIGENNYNDPADILWRLDQRFVDIFNMNVNERGDNDVQDGCDLAVLFIAENGSVKISSGHIHVFVCDGREVRRIKGQNIYIGEGNLSQKNHIQSINIPANPDNKYYIASDGLFDQIGGEHELPYGYKEFKQIILDNHHEKQSVISDKIWIAYEKYRGNEARVDDFELVSFKP